MLVATDVLSEADLLNVALFGMTAAQWRQTHPEADGKSAIMPPSSSSCISFSAKASLTGIRIISETASIAAKGKRARTSSTRSTAASCSASFTKDSGNAGRTAPPDIERLLGNIPYLNGGLFDVHELEKPERYGKDIQIPDKAFERVFDYFDQYQWHLDERPLRADNEVNPDRYIYDAVKRRREQRWQTSKEPTSN